MVEKLAGEELLVFVDRFSLWVRPSSNRPDKLFGGGSSSFRKLRLADYIHN
jgi:hypothetical protein